MELQQPYTRMLEAHWDDGSFDEQKKENLIMIWSLLMKLLWSILIFFIIFEGIKR